VTTTLVMVISRRGLSDRVAKALCQSVSTAWATVGQDDHGYLPPWDVELLDSDSLLVDVAEADRAALAAYRFVSLPLRAERLATRSEWARVRVGSFLFAIHDGVRGSQIRIGFWRAFLQYSKKKPPLSVARETYWVTDCLLVQPNELLEDVRTSVNRGAR